MQGALKNMQEVLQKNSFLFVLSEPLDVANLYLSLAMGLYLGKQGKEVTFYISPGFNESAKAYLIRTLKQYSLSFIEKVQDTQYVIAISYQDGALDKVSYDTKDGKFMLYISPTPGAEFNFDNVEYQKGGTAFESLLVFGKQWESARTLVEQNKRIAAITNRAYIDSSVGGNAIKHGAAWSDLKLEQGTVLEFIFQSVLAKEHLGKNSTTLLLASLLRIIDPFKAVNVPASLLSMVQELLQREAHLPAAFKNAYFYKDIKWLEINQLLFANLQVDHDAKVAWSIVDGSPEIQEYLRKGNFIGDAQLPITTVHGVRLGFVIYYVGDGLAHVALESDGSLNLQNFLPGFTYTGSQTKGLIEIRGADSSSIKALVLEKIGMLTKEVKPDLPKRAVNDTINTSNTTVGPNQTSPVNSVSQSIPALTVSRDLDDNLIEPPPVVPV